VLVFTYIGFKQVEVPVNNRESINVQLEEDTSTLNEVIVTGYGTTTTRASLTGAMDALNAEEIEDLPLGNLGAALAGRILGLSVEGGTSRPGSTAQLTVRNPMSL